MYQARSPYCLSCLTKFSLLALLFLAVLCLPLKSEARQWSERKLEKTVLRIDRDISRNRWDKVIKHSQKSLPQCVRLYSEQHPTCILILKNINQAYEKTRRINPDHSQIERAYSLASEVLGKTHFTTIAARNYYYIFLIYTKNYAPAIPLVTEMIEIEEAGSNDKFRLMERYSQLYTLEGLIGNRPAEEVALTKVVELSADVMGEESDYFRDAAEALAYNYCIQKKYYKFFQLIKQHKIEISCLSKQGS